MQVSQHTPNQVDPPTTAIPPMGDLSSLVPSLSTCHDAHGKIDAGGCHTTPPYCTLDLTPGNRRRLAPPCHRTQGRREGCQHTQRRFPGRNDAHPTRPASGSLALSDRQPHGTVPPWAWQTGGGIGHRDPSAGPVASRTMWMTMPIAAGTVRVVIHPGSIGRGTWL